MNRRLPGAEVVPDPDPSGPIRSPWRTYRECLRLTPAAASHRVVVQDDSIPCRDFMLHAVRAITARPSDLICFYSGGALVPHLISISTAAEQGESWARLSNDSWIPAVAISWPAWMIPHVLAETRDGLDSGSSADDQVIGDWCRGRGITPLATVPSLVDHRDGHRSLVGGPVGMRFREAVRYIGADDPSLISWD